MPFADYEDFEACERANSDKRDPAAYCAAIQEQAKMDLDVEHKSAPEPTPLSESNFADYELDIMALEVKAWERYEGPRGGEGWKNTQTGDIVYQDEKPDGDSASSGDGGDGVDIDVSDGIPREAVSKVTIAADEMGGFDRLNVSRVVSTEDLPEQYQNSIAGYEHRTGTLAINPDLANDETAEEWRDDEIIAGDSLEHVMSHEMVHAAVQASGEDPGMWFDDDSHREVASSLSHVAKQNPNELVAEVGAMLLTGEEVPEELRELYEHYGGPDL